MSITMRTMRILCAGSFNFRSSLCNIVSCLLCIVIVPDCFRKIMESKMDTHEIFKRLDNVENAIIRLDNNISRLNELIEQRFPVTTPMVSSELREILFWNSNCNSIQLIFQRNSEEVGSNYSSPAPALSPAHSDIYKIIDLDDNSQGVSIAIKILITIQHIFLIENSNEIFFSQLYSAFRLIRVRFRKDSTN